MSQVSLPNITNSDVIFPFEQWNGDHHISVPNGIVEGEDYHVFAIVGGSAYKESADHIPVDIVIPLGPAQIRLAGYIDTPSLEVDITAYLRVPFIPEVILGHFKGNVKDGIEIKVHVFGIIHGTLKLYIKDRDGKKWLYLAGNLELFGKKSEFDIPVIPIPP